MKRLLDKKKEATRTVRKRSHREPVSVESSVRIRRWLRPLIRFPWALPGLGVLVALGFGVHHFIHNSPYFEIEEIEISGLERTPRDLVLHSIEEHAWVIEGTTLFLVDVDKVRESVERLVTIRDAVVYREWPNRLVVEAVEVIPAGILVTDSGSHVFCREGWIFGETRAADLANSSLMMLTGATVVHDEEGVRVSPKAFDHFRRYDEIFRLANRTLLDSVAEFQWHDDRGMTIHLSSGSLYHCGFRSPSSVGPLVEILMEKFEGTAQAPISANLFSDHSIAIAGRKLPETTVLRHLALHHH